jgi:hypothetical protein
MKHLLHFTVCAGLLAMVACTSGSTQQSAANNPTNATFQQFLKKFKLVSLPLRLRPSDDLTTDGLAEINGHTSDTLFIHTDEEIAWAYGLLPDTSVVYQVVWLAPAETFQPYLTTFSKTGKKISEAHIGIGGCGADCGFECSETVIVSKDMSIYAADSISITQCDEQGNLVDGTTRHLVRSTAGKVSPDGKITMSAETEHAFKLLK